MNGVTLEQQAVCATAARRHGGYQALVDHLARQAATPPPGCVWKMTVVRGANGQLRVMRAGWGPRTPKRQPRWRKSLEVLKAALLM